MQKIRFTLRQKTYKKFCVSVDSAKNIKHYKMRRENFSYINYLRFIRRRQNSLKLLKDFIAISDEAVVFDNTTAYEPVFYKSADGKEFKDETSWLYLYLY